MTFRDDEYYIARVLEGNREAYRSIVEKHQDFVFTIVRRIIATREDAEEVAQDVFVKAYEKLRDFKGEARFSTWLYRIAYNAAISHTRKRKVEFPAGDDERIDRAAGDEVSNEFHGLSQDEQRRLIHRAMAELPATDSLIVTLFYFHGKELEEIGGIIDMTRNNVKVKLHRIRKRMFKEINEILERDPENNSRRMTL